LAQAIVPTILCSIRNKVSRRLNTYQRLPGGLDNTGLLQGQFAMEPNPALISLGMIFGRNQDPDWHQWHGFSPAVTRISPGIRQLSITLSRRVDLERWHPWQLG
jgi:hypothetical protein